MTVPASIDSPRALADYLEAYESTFRRQGGAQISDHLPAPDDPLYLPVLVELVRIELELGWEQGRPTSLLEYQRRFPQLVSDSAALQAVALEELRQRLMHGEKPSAEEYQRLYGVHIPDLTVDRTCNVQATASLTSTEGLLARAYQRFRELGASASAAAGSILSEGRPPAGEVSGLSLAPLAGLPSGRQPTEWQPFPEAGQEFMGFRLLQELGRGAFARVFLARQGNLANRLVALKIAPRLFDESQTLAQLQHTNIVPIYSFHQAGTLQGVCMPFFGPTTLGDLLRSVAKQPSVPKSGKALVGTIRQRCASTHTGKDSRPRDSANPRPLEPLPSPSPKTELLLEHLDGLSYVEAVLWIGARLAEGLAHAHQCGVVHRDLKPANVLMADDGRPMLLDFNLSQDAYLRDQESRVGGTLPYMAPEHLRAFAGKGGTIDGRSDLYSLGVILYEMLAGRHPFPATQHSGSLETVVLALCAERSRLPANLRQLNPAVSPAAAAIVQRCLEPDPNRRYQSARQLLEDLERQLAHQPLRHTREPSVRERAAKWVRRHPRLATSGLVAVVLIALGLPGAAWAVAREQRLTQQAFLGRRQFQEDLLRVRYLVNNQPTNHADLQQALQRGQTALQRYGVLDDLSWKSKPAFGYLSKAEQQKLGDEIAELLLLLAAGREMVATEADGSEPLREALQWNHLAEQAMETGFWQSGWHQRARLAQRLQRPEEAREAQQRASEARPRTAQDYFLLGSQQLEQKRFKAALPPFQEATRIDPKHFGAWLNLGICLSELADHQRAADCLSTALSLEPDNAEVYFQRGETYEKIRFQEKALDDLEQAVRLRPEEMKYRIARARVKGSLKRHKEAIAELSALLETEGAPTRLYFFRAAERQRAGDLRGAAEDRKEGLSRVPTDEFSWTARGYARLGKDNEGALADFEEALKINPRFLPALENKAHVLMERLNRPEDALAVLNREIELYPEFVVARQGRGVQLARLGRREEALKDADYCLQHSRAALTYYQCANIFALTSRQKPEDAARAYPLLLAALAYGFNDADPETDTDFDPIRHQPQFKTTVQTARSLRTAIAPPRR